jgi:hypothetical protein
MWVRYKYVTECIAQGQRRDAIMRQNITPSREPTLAVRLHSLRAHLILFRACLVTVGFSMDGELGQR